MNDSIGVVSLVERCFLGAVARPVDGSSQRTGDASRRNSGRSEVTRIFAARDLAWFVALVGLSIAYWIACQRPPDSRYTVQLSGDGETLMLVDTATGVTRLIPTKSLDPEDIFRRIKSSED